MRFVIVAVCLTLELAGQTPQNRRLRADLEFLCSDALGGRVSLSHEAEVAARYIAADFQRSGLAPANGSSYLQEFPLVAYRTDPHKRVLKLTRGGVQRAWKPGEDFTGAFSRDVHLGPSPVVFAGFGITAPEYGYDDYAGIDAKGKVVLVFDHEPKEDDPRAVFNGTGHTLHAGRTTKVANARRHGALAVLVASEPVRSHRGLLEPAPGGAGQGQPLRANAPPQSLDDDAQIPAFSISDAVLAELLGQAADRQRSIESGLRPQSADLPDTRIELGSGNAEMHRGISLNVAGLLEGSDPVLKSETVLITAHYDHLGTQHGRVYAGANDNASGTVAVMELARMFAASGQRPKRSLLFVVFGSEEQLMLGSFYYTAHPLRPLAGTRAVLNLDMIARDEAHIPQSEGVLKISADTSNELNLVGAFYSPELLKLIEEENRTAGLVLDTKFDRDHTLNALFRCDHLPFLAADIPAVWLFGGFHPGYHEPSDTVEKLNFPKMEKVIRLTYAAAAKVADGTKPPKFGVEAGTPPAPR
ncbi:M28 family peptidase [Paludibaculum fermentans]|uniref:M28 family peptidase n=1 Tax=Paludibaculum fermentans TaxID=1473598 RepID=UPI003EB9AE5D